MLRLIFIALLFAFVQLSFAEDSIQEPERTAEGYRIIRITPETMQSYRDSVYAAMASRDSVNFEKTHTMDTITHTMVPKEEAAKPVYPCKFRLGVTAGAGLNMLTGTAEAVDPTYEDESKKLYSGYFYRLGILALIPLSKYSWLLKLGIQYENSSMDIKNSYVSKLNNGSRIENVSISQEMLSFPVLVAMKSPHGRSMFQIGLQASIPLTDKLSPNASSSTPSIDLIDVKARSAVDVSLLFGVEWVPTDRFSIDFMLGDELFTDAYQSKFATDVTNLHFLFMRLGVSFYII